MTDVLRLIAGGILAVISSYIGLIIKNRYKSREKFYFDAKNFAEILKRDIGFYEKSLPDIVKEFLPSASAEFAELLNVYLGTIKAQNTDFSHLEKTRLKPAEISDFERFFSALGKSAQYEQMTLVNSFY
ncbi:MAG: stage III sporulation protein AB, partial [Clostridia bacterium]|nr:stage III sporulation protein AB [Clostridia bacterium]